MCLKRKGELMRHTPKEILMYLNRIHNGDWDLMFRDVQRKIEIPEEIDISQNYDCICILDPEYPVKLKQSFKPPFLLFKIGNLALLNEPNIMCVCGEKGSNTETVDLIKHICDSYVVINSDSSKIERTALETAMKEGKKFIVVCSEPLDNALDYDDEVIQYGLKNDCLFISEYGYGQPKIPKGELASTRIVGFLADKMLVVSASKDNLRLKLLIDECLSKGSDLFALPTEPFKNSLNNSLLKEGALLVDSKDDIF